MSRERFCHAQFSARNAVRDRLSSEADAAAEQSSRLCRFCLTLNLSDTLLMVLWLYEPLSASKVRRQMSMVRRHTLVVCAALNPLLGCGRVGGFAERLRWGKLPREFTRAVTRDEVAGSASSCR